jgi:C2H2-type zinc finger/zinc-finger of a C2HC-type
VELNDSIPYACEMCVSKMTEFERLRAQIRESDRILKGAFTGGLQASPTIIAKSESPLPDNISEFEVIQIKDELPTPNPAAEAILLGMKVEFVDPELELLRIAEEPKPKRTRKAPVRSNEFYCCMCPKNFKNKADQLKHAATEHTKFRYNYQSAEMTVFLDCDMCGRKFQNEKRLQSHQYRFTTYQQCDLCGEILPNNSTHVMQKHLADHHSTEVAKKVTKQPQFTCDICERKFQVKKSLKNHMEEHSE